MVFTVLSKKGKESESFFDFLGLSFGKWWCWKEYGGLLESQHFCRLQAVGDNKSPSVEASRGWKQPVTQKLHQPLVPGRPPASSRVKTRQEVGGVERVPPTVPATSLPTTVVRRSSSFQRRRKPAADEVPSTSQFLTGGRREQTLRRCRSFAAR